MSEHAIQNALYREMFARRRWPIFPNCDVITGYEADLICLTKKRMAYEYEIKCSVSDLRADRKKLNKWASIEGRTKEWPNPWKSDGSMIQVRADMPEQPDPNGRRYWALDFQCHPERRPREFWYACHGFDPPLDEIPAVAGVMLALHDPDQRYRQGWRFEEVRPAVKLESQPVEESRIAKATGNMLYRYWSMRTQATTAPGVNTPLPDSACAPETEVVA